MTCSHFASILLINTIKVQGMSGNYYGNEKYDLRTLQSEAIDANTYGWSWRIPQQEARV